MRSVDYPSAFLEQVRSVQAELAFRDDRLRFTYFPTSETPAEVDFSDSATYNLGVLQVARFKADPDGTLRFRYITDISAIPAWTSFATGLTAIYHLAVRDNRLFITNGSGMNYADWNGTAFGSFVPDAHGANSLVAPLSTSVVYFLKYSSTTPYVYGKISRYTIGGAEVFWYGRLYDKTPIKAFDAEGEGFSEWVYATEESGGRTVYVMYNSLSNAWSEKRFVIPLDVIDDVSQFRLGGAAKFGSKVVVSGVLKRSYGAMMHVYSMAEAGNFSKGDKYSLSRDMFVGTANTNGGGKLHAIYDIGAGINEVWHIGPGVVYKSRGTQLSASSWGTEYITSAMVSINMSAASNQPFTLQADIPASEMSPIIRPGSVCRVTVIANGLGALLGEFNVDAVLNTQDASGLGKTVVMRSKNMKNAATWTSDAPYDYWSQTKQSANPKDMAKVIRATGQWKEENNALTTYDLNTDGILYSSAKASRNAIMRAKFKQMPGDWNSRFGVGVNYYIESKAEVSERLSKALEEVLETDYGQNGIFAIFGKKEHAGAEGVGLYLLVTNAWTKLASAACTIADNTDTWAQIKFIDGFIQVFTRTTGAWTKVLEYTFERADAMPWRTDSKGWNEYQGRGAIFVRNETGTSKIVYLPADGTILPVEDNSSFNASDTLVIDGERLTYSGKTLNRRENAYEVQATITSITYGGSTAYPNPVWQPLGMDNTCKRIKQPLRNFGTGYTFWGMFIGIAKVGNPSDIVKVTVYSSANAVKAIMTCPADRILSLEESEHRGVVGTAFVLANKTWTAASGDYYVVQRASDATVDPNNYYVAYTMAENTGAANSAAIAAQKYNGSAYSYLQPVAFGIHTACLEKPTGLAGNYVVVNSSFQAIYDGYNNGQIVDAYNGQVCVAHRVGKPDELFFFKINDTDYKAPYPHFTSEYYGVLFLDRAYGPLGSMATSGTENDYTGTLLEIYPAMTGLVRGADGTAKTEHRNATAHAYRAGPFIYISQVEYFSSEVDMGLDDMVGEITAKCGAGEVKPVYIYPMQLYPYTSSAAVARKNFIAKLFAISTPNGTIIVEGRKPDAASAGTSLIISGSTLQVGSEVIDTGSTIKGWITVSFYEDLNQTVVDNELMDNPILIISVWQDGTLLHTFTPETWTDGEYFKIKGTSRTPLYCFVSDSCMRVDNFILDEGQKGAGLIESLIGEKRFFFQEMADGTGVRLFRERTEVNAGDPYLLAISDGAAESDGNLATRVRIEGGDVVEVIDEEMMREHGNIYALVHMNEVNSQADAEYYAGVALDDFGSRYENITLQGAADPRIEPNDIIYFETTGGTRKVIVDSIEFQMNSDPNSAVFDMTISGRTPRSEL